MDRADSFRPGSATPMRARAEDIERLMGSLAKHDLHGKSRVPAESYQVALTTLRSIGSGDPRLMIQVHRVFFPFLGKNRSAMSRRAGITTIPPAHPFFMEVLRDSIIGDNVGWAQARKRYGAPKCANAVGAGACLIAAVGPTRDEAWEIARRVASLVQRDRDAVALGCYAGMLSWLVVRFGRPGGESPAEILENRMAEIVEQHPSLAPIHDAVQMGGVDDTAALGADDDLMNPIDAARAAGRWWISGVAPLGTGVQRVVRPLAAPLMEYHWTESDEALDRLAIEETRAVLAEGSVLPGFMVSGTD